MLHASSSKLMILIFPLIKINVSELFLNGSDVLELDASSSHRSS